MKVTNKISSIKKIAVIIFSATCYFIAFANFFLLSMDLIYGNHYGEKVFPKPFFGFTRIYDRPNTLEHNAINRLAIDYAQVYFPSQEFSSLTKNYETGYLDPLNRPSRYAPFIHYLCSISFCKLDYGYASFAHMLTQVLLFYFFFILAFKILDIEGDLRFGLLITTSFLFITPIGLGWLEKGQFSLYVCLAYLLLILGIIKKNDILIIVSAFFAYVKWTSFPFLLVILVISVMSSKNPKEFIKSSRSALIYFLVLILLSLAFRSRFIHFLDGLLLQEAYVQPVGISMSQLLPAWIVKGLPLLFIILGYLCLIRNNKDINKLIPFFTGAGILMLTYPTVAFEYNIPNLFCFIPLIFYWAKDTSLFNKLLKYGFFLFILLISCPNYISVVIRGNNMLLFYLFASCILIMMSILYPEIHKNQLGEADAS